MTLFMSSAGLTSVLALTLLFQNSLMDGYISCRLSSKKGSPWRIRRGKGRLGMVATLIRNIGGLKHMAAKQLPQGQYSSSSVELDFTRVPKSALGGIIRFMPVRTASCCFKVEGSPSSNLCPLLLPPPQVIRSALTNTCSPRSSQKSQLRRSRVRH